MKDFKPSPTILYWGYGYSIAWLLGIVISICIFTPDIYVYVFTLILSIFLYFYISSIYTDKDIENLEKQDKDNGG